MLIQFLNVLRSPLTVFVLLSIQVLAFPSTTLAQNEGLTFEQAQTRTTFARKQMQATQRALNEAETREVAALRELSDLQKLQDQARKNANQATEERQVAETKHQEAQDRWSRESERLKRIHQRNNTNSSTR